MIGNYVIGSIFILLLQAVSGLKILGVFTHSGKSHFDVFQPLLKTLAERGHEVTVISHFPLDEPMKNYKDISMRGSMPIWKMVFSFEDFTFYKPTEMFVRHVMTGYLIADFGNLACRSLMNIPEVHTFKPEQFDIAIVETFNSDCGLALPYKLNIPYIGVTSHVLFAYTLQRLGLIENPSVVAPHYSEYGYSPNLWHTAENLIINNIYKWIYYHSSQRIDHEILSQYISDLPPLDAIARNTSLVLVNAYFPLNGVNLFPPNVIEVGGIHLTNKTSILPPVIQKFLDECDEGVIVFCMGSMIKAVSWPEDKLKAFKTAFAEIPQTVVWKWENETMEGLSNNVKLFKWLPQFDVLKHKNVKGFITHAGNLGMTEAVSLGVPVLSIPLYGDQFHNAGSAKFNEMGVIIDYRNITVESIRWGLNELLGPRLQYGAKRVSKLWNDRPSSAVDTAIYWIEYVARNGGEHFRAPTLTVPWYRYLLLDVISLILFILFAILILFYKILVFVYNIAFKNKAKKTENSLNNKSMMMMDPFWFLY